MNIKKRKITASNDFDLCDAMCGSGFFTRDDLNEYIADPLETMIKDNFDCNNLSLQCYIEDDNRLECDIDIDGTMFTITCPIDFRRIKKISDLQKYAIQLLKRFEDEYADNLGIAQIEGCNITSSMNTTSDIKSSKKDNKFEGFCYYTAVNPTWGGDAWRRVEKVGGKKAEYKEPKRNGKGYTPARWIYLFPSKEVYDQFAKLLVDDKLDKVVKLERYQRIPEGAEYKIQKIGASTNIKATTYKELSVEEFDQLVDSYREAKAGWSLIVAELKGTYGLDIAKEVADAACYENKVKDDGYVKSNSELPILTKYSEELRPEIFEFLDECGNYTDYNQKVEDVAEQWNMTKDLAEEYVWNWSIQVNYDDEEEEEY